MQFSQSNAAAWITTSGSTPQPMASSKAANYLNRPTFGPAPNQRTSAKLFRARGGNRLVEVGTSRRKRALASFALAGARRSNAPFQGAAASRLLGRNAAGDVFADGLDFRMTGELNGTQGISGTNGSTAYQIIKGRFWSVLSSLCWSSASAISHRSAKGTRWRTEATESRTNGD